MTPIQQIPITTVLTSAIVPVTLISGVAFLTSIMAPRFGRCIDRIRTILLLMKTTPPQSREHEIHLKQLKILYARATILRNTMTVAGFCILFVVFTIGATFSHLLLGFPGTGFVVTTFVLAFAWLVLLTIGFIYDFLCSLKAVKIEIDSGLEVALESFRDSRHIKNHSENSPSLCN